MSDFPNPAAFPDPGRAQSVKQREFLTETGMTLRDYFAAHALPALLLMSNAEFDKWYPDTNAAGAAYVEADAMLQARLEASVEP